MEPPQFPQIGYNNMSFTAMIKAADLGNPEKVKAIIHLVIVMFTHTLNTLHRHWVRKPKNLIDHHHLQMLTVIFAERDQKKLARDSISDRHLDVDQSCPRPLLHLSNTLSIISASS